nr:RecName: Full=42 kDa cell wall protein; AltName: Full=40 kDa cell wall protein [Nicotiana tabacum]
QPEESVFFA